MKTSDCRPRQQVRFPGSPRLWTIEHIDGNWIQLRAADDDALCGTTADALEPVEPDALPEVSLADALGRLGAEAEPPPGWQERVLAAAPSRRCVLCWIAVAGISVVVGIVLGGTIGVLRGKVPLPTVGPVAALLYAGGFAGWIALGILFLAREWRKR